MSRTRFLFVSGWLIALTGLLSLPVHAQDETFEITVNMSGTINGVFVGPATFTLTTLLDRSGTSITVSGTLPDPATVFPSASIGLADWQKMNVPYPAYIPPQLCVLLCPEQVNCFELEVCPSPDGSPDGIDEVFAVAWTNGDILEGITDFDLANGVVDYQFSARFQPSAPDFSSQGTFSFPATEALEPIQPSGTIMSFHADGSVSDATFNGLVLLKNREGRLPFDFSMEKTMTFEGLDFVLEADVFAEQVCICHIPPGNPANAHTICIDESAVPAHLEHGDTLEPCSPRTGFPQTRPGVEDRNDAGSTQDLEPR